MKYTPFDSEDISKANNGDGIIQPGETIDLAIGLRNQWGAAKDVTITVNATTNGIDNQYVEFISDNEVAIDEIGSFGTQNNGFIYNESKTVVGVEHPIRIKIKENAPNDLNIQFNINYKAKNGLDENDTTVYRQSYDTTYTIHIVKGTVLSGKITEDTTLTADNYYIIKNSLLIPKGVTVNVEPGTKIQFWASDQYSAYGDNYIACISVKGNMHFNGTESQPIDLFPGKDFEQYCVNVKKSDSGTVDMNYVNITNPTIDISSGSHLNCVQNMDLVYDRYFNNGNLRIDTKGARIYAEYLGKSKISNFRSKPFYTGAMVFGNMDTVLFDNCYLTSDFYGDGFIGNVKSSINCTYLVNEATVDSDYGTSRYASKLVNPGEYFRTPDCSVVSNIYNVNGKKYVAYKFDNYFYRENYVDGYDTKAFDNYLTLEKVLEKNNANLAMLNLNDTDEKNILNKVFNDILGEGSSKDLELAGGYYYDEMIMIKY